MASEEFKEKYVELLHKIDDLLVTGPWDEGLLFSAVKKRLEDYRAFVVQEYGSEFLSEEPEVLVNTSISAMPDEMLVYVSVYCSEGHSLERWQGVVVSLGSTIISRPIYKFEEDALAIVRSKPNRSNEAYCGLWVSKQDIAKPFTGDAPKDKLGHELLVLKTGAIKVEKIAFLVHQDQKYLWESGKLILEKSAP